MPCIIVNVLKPCKNKLSSELWTINNTIRIHMGFSLVYIGQQTTVLAACCSRGAALRIFVNVYERDIFNWLYIQRCRSNVLWNQYVWSYSFNENTMTRSWDKKKEGIIMLKRNGVKTSHNFVFCDVIKT